MSGILVGLKDSITAVEMTFGMIVLICLFGKFQRFSSLKRLRSKESLSTYCQGHRGALHWLILVVRIISLCLAMTVSVG